MLTIYKNNYGNIKFINGDIYEGELRYALTNDHFFIPYGYGTYYFNDNILYHSVYGEFSIMDDEYYIHDTEYYNKLFNRNNFLDSLYYHLITYISKTIHNSVIIDKEYVFTTALQYGYTHIFKDIIINDELKLTYLKTIQCKKSLNINNWKERISETIKKINENYNSIVDQMNLIIRNNLNVTDMNYILLYTNQGDYIINNYLSNNREISRDIFNYYKQLYTFGFRRFYQINNDCYIEDTDKFIKCFIETCIDGLSNNIRKISPFLLNHDLVVYRQIEQKNNIYKKNQCITLSSFSSTSLNLKYVVSRIIGFSYEKTQQINTFDIKNLEKDFKSLNKLNIREIDPEGYLMIILIPENFRYLPIFDYYGMNLNESEDEILLPYNINLYINDITDDNKIFCTIIE